MFEKLNKQNLKVKTSRFKLQEGNAGFCSRPKSKVFAVSLPGREKPKAKRNSSMMSMAANVQIAPDYEAGKWACLLRNKTSSSNLKVLHEPFECVVGERYV